MTDHRDTAPSALDPTPIMGTTEVVAPRQPGSDKARYVAGSDWIADGAQLPPGAAFAQSWQVHNTGETTWGFGYKLLWIGDKNLGAPPWIEAPACPPGEQVRITVPYLAPLEVGLHKSTWQLCNSRGERFGDQLWVIIEVVTPATAPPEADSQHFPPPSDQLISLAPGADPLTQTVADTWNDYGGLLLEEAQKLGIDPGVATAVLVAEANGKAFGSDGRMIIRFENHIFYEEWGKRNEARYQQFFRFDPVERWRNHQWRNAPNETWQPCHIDQRSEWAAFAFACSLDETAAMRSTSMAAPQIMGFNHSLLGYSTVQQMFHAFQTDVREQLHGLFRFIERNGLGDVLRSGDFYTFAKLYNGMGQAQTYRQIIQQNMAIYQNLMRHTPGLRTRGGVNGQPALAQPLSSPWTTGPLQPNTDDDLGRYAAWRKRTAQKLLRRQAAFPQMLDSILYPYRLIAWLCGAFGMLSFATVVLICLVTKKFTDSSYAHPSNGRDRRASATDA